MYRHMLAICTAASVLAGGLFIYAPPAQAGFFERLFSGLRHAFHAPRLPDTIREFAPPDEQLGPGERSSASERVSGTAFCVRSCDGHFFPVLAHPGMSAAEACHAFCPASRTRLYSGSTIDTAVAQDGSRYTDSPNAFVYRQHLVAGCTCNGHDAFGLAHVDVEKDPTLRPGDVVATNNGMMAYIGRDGTTAQFTPADDYRHFSPTYRRKLSEMEVRSAER
jgi:hypothetical protein